MDSNLIGRTMNFKGFTGTVTRHFVDERGEEIVIITNKNAHVRVNVKYLKGLT